MFDLQRDAVFYLALTALCQAKSNAIHSVHIKTTEMLFFFSGSANILCILYSCYEQSKIGCHLHSFICCKLRLNVLHFTFYFVCIGDTWLRLAMQLPCHFQYKIYDKTKVISLNHGRVQKVWCQKKNIMYKKNTYK